MLHRRNEFAVFAVGKKITAYKLEVLAGARQALPFEANPERLLLLFQTKQLTTL